MRRAPDILKSMSRSLRKKIGLVLVLALIALYLMAKLDIWYKVRSARQQQPAATEARP